MASQEIKGKMYKLLRKINFLITSPEETQRFRKRTNLVPPLQGATTKKGVFADYAGHIKWTNGQHCFTQYIITLSTC
jgi:hypothetical protein